MKNHRSIALAIAFAFILLSVLPVNAQPSANLRYQRLPDFLRSRVNLEQSL
jgi:hypothetical protein